MDDTGEISDQCCLQMQFIVCQDKFNLGVRVHIIQRLNKIVENDKKYARSLKNK